MTPAPDGKPAALLDQNPENQCNLLGSGRLNSTRGRHFGLLGVPEAEITLLFAVESVTKCECDICTLFKISWDISEYLSERVGGTCSQVTVRRMGLQLHLSSVVLDHLSWRDIGGNLSHDSKRRRDQEAKADRNERQNRRHDCALSTIDRIMNSKFASEVYSSPRYL